MTSHLSDTNVWLALALPSHPHHAATRAWFDAIEDPDSIFFCRSTQQSFLRLMSSRAMLAPFGAPPLTNEQAWAAYEAFLADDRILFQPAEPAGLERYWKQHAARGTSSPNLWMDAYLAAFAIAGNYRLVTTDTDFRQFRGLDVLVLGDSARS